MYAFPLQCAGSDILKQHSQTETRLVAVYRGDTLLASICCIMNFMGYNYVSALHCKDGQ